MGTGPRSKRGWSATTWKRREARSITSKLGLRYRDEVTRFDRDWKISRREAVLQWHTGPFPRPLLGDPPYPRKTHRSAGAA
jgi:hypothetical protein